MKEAIKRITPDAEFFTPEQCYILELSNTPEDSEASIARARILPGVSTRWHKVIDTAERYVILQGQGIVEIGELAPQEVGAGDVVLIPPSCPQRITNNGTDELVLLAICTPRFLQENYLDIELEQSLR